MGLWCLLASSFMRLRHSREMCPGRSQYEQGPCEEEGCREPLEGLDVPRPLPLPLLFGLDGLGSFFGTSLACRLPWGTERGVPLERCS